MYMCIECAESALTPPPRVVAVGVGWGEVWLCGAAMPRLGGGGLAVAVGIDHYP